MNKKVVVLGGGTGQSNLLKGLKMFPLDITAVVSVSDDGKSSGALREIFNIPAVGDIRRVLIALSETEDVIEKLVGYRFKTDGEFNGHSLGNIILTALSNIYGNLSNGVKEVSKLLNLKGKVLPLTDDNVVLVAKMKNGQTIEGEHNITESGIGINKVYYKKNPKINNEVLESIQESDAIVLSMGSLFTSVIPNIISKEVIKSIDNSNAKIIYVCNIMTQPGETDDYKVSDHINLLNSYLGKRKIDAVIVNNELISKSMIKKYQTLEQKDPVLLDRDKIKINIISKPLLIIDKDNTLKHDSTRLGLEILNYLIK